MALQLGDLQKAVREDAAICGHATLQAMGNENDKVFPPTHAVDEKRLRRDDRLGAKYAWEKRRIDGKESLCVMLDSVQSQANRMEDALHRLWRAGKIIIPVITVNFGVEFPDLTGINSLTAPHRIADALLRDSYVDNTLFRHSKLGKSFADATLANAAALFKVSPTALLFGIWDSTGPRGGLGFKLARNITSEIIGIDAFFGTKTGSRIDPVGIVKNAGKLYAALDPLEQWTLESGPEHARRKKKKKPTDPDEPELYKGEGTPAKAIHGNIPPSVDMLAGGISISKAEQTVVLSLAGIRRLGFGTPEESQAAHTVLVALGLVAVVAASDDGYFLRSRCHLSPKKPDEALKFKCVAKDGSDGAFAFAANNSLSDVLKLYEAAVEALPEYLRWHPWDIKEDKWSANSLKAGSPIVTLEAAPKLQQLVRESRRLAVAGEVEEVSAEIEG